MSFCDFLDYNYSNVNQIYLYQLSDEIYKQEKLNWDNLELSYSMTLINIDEAYKMVCLLSLL